MQLRASGIRGYQHSSLSSSDFLSSSLQTIPRLAESTGVWESACADADKIRHGLGIFARPKRRWMACASLDQQEGCYRDISPPSPRRRGQTKGGTWWEFGRRGSPLVAPRSNQFHRAPRLRPKNTNRLLRFSWYLPSYPEARGVYELSELYAYDRRKGSHAKRKGGWGSLASCDTHFMESERIDGFGCCFIVLSTCRPRAI